MPFPLSPQSIDAVAEIISGGVGNSSMPPIGIYRSGPRIEKFMRACNVDFQIIGSRVPCLVERLIALNRADDFEPLARVIEAAADPRDFIADPDRLSTVIDYLNSVLAFDEFAMQRQGSAVRLVAVGQANPVLEKLGGVVDTISFDTVRRDIDRALASVNQDPEDAVTAACSAVESVCRSILLELGDTLPAKKDIQSLYNAVKKPLALDPGRTDIDSQIEADVRTILGGLSTVINGIGALRTHAGDAHGRERGFVRIDARIASLALHSAGTVSLFLIETWQRKFPDRELHRH
ncbi:abortive infection family protein (plasmid) [Sphingomonas sp. gentR]|uniref:abortive infection family protein n=1 Tax=Sphingomonas sp. gentR TaxID=3118768 RepID=UPI0030CBDDEB